jgi:phosphate uptake regulator
VANSLFVGTEIEFADGKKRLIKPLTIRQLRKFVKLVDGLDANMTSLSDEDIDKMLEAAAVIIEKSDAKLAEDKESLEDAVDIVVFNALVSIAMGTDPNV